MTANEQTEFVRVPLLPCPKCGGPAAFGNRNLRSGCVAFVNCTECLLSNALIADMQRFDQMTAALNWNARKEKTS